MSLVVNKVSRKNNVCANYYAKDSITIISDPIPSNLRYVEFYDSFYKAFVQYYVECSLKPPVEKIRVKDIHYCTPPPLLAKVTNSLSEYFILRHYNVLYVFVKITCISLNKRKKKVLAPRAGFWIMWSHLVSLLFFVK